MTTAPGRGGGEFAMHRPAPARRKRISTCLARQLRRAVMLPAAWVALAAVAGLATAHAFALPPLPCASVLLACALAATAWHARRLARRIASPIGALAEAFDSIGHDAAPAPIPVTAEGELARLQEGFNLAAAALRDSRETLQQRIELATLELERKNAALEQANQARSRFLAAASHDLRQPLSALTLFSSALVMGERDPVRLSRIKNIQACVDSLDGLFTSLLDLSRLETGEMQPCPTDFALDQLFDELSHTFRIGAEQRGLRLAVRKTDAWVHADRVMLSRILNNLVCNAVRYTRSGGVLVGARRRGGHLRIDVWDTGPGIAPDKQQRVFEEFYRAEEAPPPPGERQGMGLGLATVQRLARLLDAPIRLHSRLQRGSLFSVRIPLARRHRPRVEQAVLRTAAREADLRGLRVLVVDDEPAILEGMVITLEGWGCQVRAAAGRGEALQAARGWGAPPDIVLSDLQLGRRDNGLAVLRALERHYRQRGQGSFDRLLITGATKPEQLGPAHAAGIPVLCKPVNPELLRTTIGEVLRRRGADGTGGVRRVA